jgi:hypothetical protein
MVLVACAGFKTGQWGLPFQVPSLLTPAFHGCRPYLLSGKGRFAICQSRHRHYLSYAFHLCSSLAGRSAGFVQVIGFASNYAIKGTAFGIRRLRQHPVAAPYFGC